MGTSASGVATARTRTFAAVAAAFMLALGLVPMAAFGSESVAGGFTPPEYEGDASSASADSATEGLTLASTLTSSGASVVSADVALDADEPVVASFTADGFTYTFGAEGVMLAAVDASAIGEDGSVTVPASVTLDGIDYDVTAVGPYAFYLSGATDVALPASIVSVDDRAFRSSDVARVIVDQANPNLASFDGCLYDSQLLSLLLIPEGRPGSVPIPSEAEVVEASVFSHCSLVDAISVDGGGAAFLSWDGLLYDASGTTLLRVPAGATEITIRDGCTTIAAGAMEGCAKLERINAPASVTSINPDLFASIPTVSLPVQSAMQDGSQDESVATSLVGTASTPGDNDLVQLEDADTVAADSSDQSNTSIDAYPQLAGIVALTTADNGLVQVNPSDVTVILSNDASCVPWEQAGFTVNGGASNNKNSSDMIASHAGNARDSEALIDGPQTNGGALPNDTEDSLIAPLASMQESAPYASSVSNITINSSEAGMLHWEDWTKGPQFSDRVLTASGNLPSSWSTTYLEICAWSSEANAVSRSGDSLYLQMTGSGWGGRVILLTNNDSESSFTWTRSGGTVYEPTAGSRDYHLTGPVTISVKKFFTVTFDKKGGSGGADSVGVQSGSSVPTITRPTLSGWTFRGYTDDMGTSTYLYVNAGGSGTTRTISSNKTLLANWTKTVTLNANGGTAGSLTSLTAGIGRVLGQKCTQVNSSDADYPIRSLLSKGITDSSDWAPTRAGYTFQGYYDTNASSGGTCYINASGTAQSACSPVTSTMPSTLYARWTPSVYKVTLDKNGGSGGTSTIYLKYATGWYSNAAATTNITSITTPTTGPDDKPLASSAWTFAGYKGKDKNGTTYTYVNSDGSLKNSSAWWSDFTSDTTLTAVWTKSVTLDRQGGSGGSTSATYTKGEGFTGSITAPTLSGWTFLGYCDYDPSSSPGGNVYQMIKADGISTGRVYDSIGSTIYAWWAKEVTLDKYATGATAGKATKIWALKGAKLGYACTSTTSNGVDYEADIRAKFPSPSPLKATGWAPSRGSLASTWSFDGYWTAGADGNATQYVDSSGAGTKACPADMPSTLYAQWTRSVTLDKQGGSGGSDSASQLYTNGTSNYPYRAVTPPTIPPSGSPGGWQFLGYCDYNPSTSPSGSVYQMIKSDGSSTGRAYSSTTLYAWWVKQVALNKNASNATAGATTSVWALKGAKLGYACTTAATTEAEVRAKFPSPSPLKATGWSPTRPERAFMGYSSTTADTGGMLYVDAAGDGQVAVDANCPSALYARWGYTVTFDKKGGSGGAESVGVESGSSVPTITAPTLSGWTFRGYTDSLLNLPYLYVKADGTGTTRTITGNKTLLANWTKTVTLNANGGEEGKLTSLTAAIGRKLGQKCTQVSSSDPDYPIRSLFSKGITDDSDWAPTRAGFTFQGYYSTNAATGGTCYIDADGAAQAACDPVTSTMPSTLYARWSGNDIELTWDPHNGEEAATTTQTYSTTAKVALPATPTWTGRTFAGWYTAETGGTQVTNATDLPTEDKTYHAHWTEDSYTISYDYDGGDVSGNPTTYKVSSATFTLKNPTKTGYTFTGWSGTGLTGSANMSVQVAKGSTGDRSYTAHWEANSYMVEYYDFAGTTLLSRDEGFVYGKARPLAPEPDASAVTPGYEAVGWASSAGQASAAYGFASSQQNLATGASGDEVKRLYLAESPKAIELAWVSLGEGFATTAAAFSPGAKAPMPEGMPGNDPGWAFMGWWTAEEGGEQVTADTPLPTDSTTYYAHWSPVVSADVPIEVTARVDLLGLEEQAEASGYIESRSGGSLEVAEVTFEPLEGAAQLFEGHVADVFLEALAEGSTAADLRFALDAAATEANASKLSAFALPDGYGTRVPISYRFAIPDDVLAAIDQSRFEQVTTPVGQVVYTVALA